MTLLCFLFASLCVQYLFPTLALCHRARGLHLPLRDGGCPRPTLRHHQLRLLLIAIYTMLGPPGAGSLLSAAGPVRQGPLVRPGVPGLALAAALQDPARATGPELLRPRPLLAGEIPLLPGRRTRRPGHPPQSGPAQHQPGQCPEPGQDGAQCPPSCPGRHGVAPELAGLLRLYLLALEIQGRATSSHYPYSKLEAELKQGIVLDGFQEVLSQLADACQQLGYAILVHKPYTHHKRIHWTLRPSAISWSSPTSSSTTPRPC